jgi:hypothetical protein
MIALDPHLGALIAEAEAGGMTLPELVKETA